MAPVIIKPREPQLQDPNLPMLSTRKRKQDEFVNNGLNESVPSSTIAPSTNISQGCDVEKRREKSSMLKTYISGATVSTANKKARETRLEQNRKAARESRRRKKVMIEDLQRSVIFFSRANGALKHQNDELTRLFMQAQAQVSVIESTNAVNKKQTPATTTANASANDSHLRKDGQDQQSPASSSTENESRPGVKASSNDGVAPAPATAATQVPPLPPPATNAPTYPPVAAMQPGATMQAMASFQQAAAAAMQVAVQGMQGISPGASMTTLGQPSVTTGSVSAQQAYNDTMTALAMQQAAIAASPHLMAQLVGSTCNNGGWVAAPPTSATSAPPTTILPATTTSTSTQATSAIPPSTTTSAPVVTGNTTTSVAAAPVPVAPMPNVTMTKGVGEA